jgi:AbiTii
MATIVEKLQQAALDSKAPVSDLLRRVKFVAAKLGLGSVEDWVEQELNGYQTTPPDYRMVHGRPMARNPVRGWMPMGGATEPLSSMMAYEAVSALEALVASTKDRGSLHKGFPDKIQAALDREVGTTPLRFRRARWRGYWTGSGHWCSIGLSI